MVPGILSETGLTYAFILMERIISNFYKHSVNNTMDAVRTSEMSVNFNVTTRLYIPEDSKLHTRRRENLKSQLRLNQKLVKDKNDVRL
jgi:hypothetical protein